MNASSLGGPSRWQERQLASYRVCPRAALSLRVYAIADGLAVRVPRRFRWLRRPGGHPAGHHDHECEKRNEKHSCMSSRSLLRVTIICEASAAKTDDTASFGLRLLIPWRAESGAWRGSIRP